MNRVLCVVIIVLLVACGALGLGLNHYRDNAITYKAQRDKKVRELELANATITDMQIRQRDVAALDARYSRELADARAENETLLVPMLPLCQRQDYWPFFAIFNVRYWSLMLSACRHFIITDWRGVFCQHSRFAFFL